MLTQLLLAASMTALPEPARPAPIAWSPDSQWIALVSRAGELETFPAPWALFPDDKLRESERLDAFLDHERPRARKLWLVRASDGEAVELDTTPGPLGGPVWAPSARSLAYLRINEHGVGRSRVELVVRGPEPGDRVLWSRSLDTGSTGAERIEQESAAWSSDGGLIAVTLPWSSSVVVVAADDGAIVAEIADASLPSWNLESTRLAVVRDAGDGPASIVFLDLATARELSVPLPSGAPMQPALWLADGRTVLTLVGQGGADGLTQAVLFQIDSRLGRATTAKTIDNPILPQQRLEGVSMAMRPDALHQFYVVNAAGQGRESAISTHQGRMPMARFHPIGGELSIGDLALSPDGRRLAMTFSTPGLDPAAALFNVEKHDLMLVAPDDDARARWLILLLSAARSYLIVPPGPRPDAIEAPPLAPTLIPLTTDAAPSDPTRNRLRGIDQLARPLLRRDRIGRDRPHLVDACHLLFAALRGEGRAALATLDRVEPTIDRPALRWRLMGLRAQLEASTGETARANSRLDYLANRSTSPVARIESGGDIETLEDPEAGWIESLRRAFVPRSEGVDATIDGGFGDESILLPP